MFLPCDLARCTGNNCNNRTNCKRYLADNKCGKWYRKIEPIWCIEEGYSMLLPIKESNEETD